MPKNCPNSVIRRGAGLDFKNHLPQPVNLTALDEIKRFEPGKGIIWGIKPFAYIFPASLSS